MNFNNDTGQIDTLLSIDTTTAPPLGGTTGTLTVVGTGALTVPVGTTAQQPTGAVGMIRYNTDLTRLESWTGSAWASTQLNAELTGLSALSANGIVTRTASGTYTSRTITGTASNITLTNGDGVSGNPTVDLATVTQGSSGTSFVKVQLDTKGRVINNTAVVAADITTLVDTTYVNVSGDTMSSAANLTFVGGGEVLGLPSVPSGSTAAVSKAYVDSISQGLDPKASVRVATIAAGTLASSFANGSTVDGITLATNDRILIKNQAAPAENGIYIVNSSGAPTRAPDMDIWTEVPNAFVFVETSGSTLADTGWVCTADQGGTINSTSIVFVQFSGAGSYVAGTGLTLSGTTFSLTAPVTLALGGTNNASLSASNGGIVWSDASKLNVLAGTVTANKVLMSGSSATPAWSTATYPSTATGTGTVIRANGTNWVASTSTFADTYAINTVLYASASNTVSGLAAGTANQILGMNTGATGLEYKTVTAGTAISVTPAANSIIIANTGVTSAVAGTAISVSGATGAVTITNTGVTAIAGTDNQITASAATGSVTLSTPSTFIAPGYVSVTGALYQSTSNTITAAGTTQGTATALTSSYNIVTTAAASTGVVLPTPALAGWAITIVNRGANAITVYPQTSATIDGGAANTGFSLPVNSTVILEAATTSTWYAVQQVDVAGTGISITKALGISTIANTGVTSVGLSLPSFMTVSGSPVTTTGTLTGTLASQTQNLAFLSPNGSSGAPTFRAIAAADLSTAIQLYKENPSAPTAPTASGTNATAIGNGSTASATNSTAIGQGTNASIWGGKAYANGSFATAGDAQKGLYVLRAITTNATAGVELFLDGAGASQRLVLPNNSVFTFTITISARRTDATGGGSGYIIAGVMKKDTTAGSTSLIGTISKTILGETNSSWDATVTADTTNGSLKVGVTGEAAKTIRWVATVTTCEVTN